MKAFFYYDGQCCDVVRIDHLPPVNSLVILAETIYSVVRHEFNYDENEIRIILVETEVFGEK